MGLQAFINVYPDKAYTDFNADKLYVQPVMHEDLYKRYLVNLDNGLIYDYKECEIVKPHKMFDRLFVTLYSEDDTAYEIAVSDILLLVSFGPTNSTSVDTIETIPSDVSNITPIIYSIQLQHKKDIQNGRIVIVPDDTFIKVNDIEFKRFRDTMLYVSKDGAFFSRSYGRFLRLSYTDRGYAVVQIKPNGKALRLRAHRVVWEAWNGPIPEEYEIDHIDDLRWHNSLNNLQLLTREENLKKANEHIWSYSGRQEKISLAARMIIDGYAPSIIEKATGVSTSTIEKIKYGNHLEGYLGKLGYDLSNIDREKRKFTPDQIREIRNRYKAGNITTNTLGREYGVSSQTIQGILKGKYYSDVV